MNDWGQIQKIKAEIEAKAIAQASEKQKSDQIQYKKHLDSLLFLKNLKQEEEKAKKFSEMQEIQINQRKIQNLESTEKEAIQEKKHHLISILNDHKAIQNKNKAEEIQRKQLEEQNYLNQIQQKLDQEARKAQARKDFLHKQQEEIRKAAEIQQKLRLEQKEYEKIQEIRLLDQQRMVEEKRQKEKQDFLNMLNMKQQQNLRNFNGLAESRSKEAFVQQWERKGLSELEQMIAREEHMRAQKKVQVKDMSQQMMREYLQGKEKEKILVESQKKRDLEEANRRLIEMKRSETESRLKELERKRMYGKELMQQNEGMRNLRVSPDVMNEAEKKMNKDFFLDKKPALQLGGSLIGSQRLPDLSGRKKYSSSPIYSGASSIILG